MRLALASTQDINAMFRVASILLGLDRGYLPDPWDPITQEPPEEDTEEILPEIDQIFDRENPEHCQIALHAILDAVEQHPSCENRVIYGFETFIHNKVHNPNLDHLDMHPDLAPIFHHRALLSQKKPDLAATVADAVAKIPADQLTEAFCYTHEYLAQLSSIIKK